MPVPGYPTRMDAVQSPIIPIVGELIRQHPGTISLGQGVAYYGPPPEAMVQLGDIVADPNNHRYQAGQGIPALLDAIAIKLKTDNQINLGNDRRIVVTAGSNMAFLNAILAITQPGDEIILQVPYYFNHDMAIAMAGCRAVLVATDANYQLQPAAIRAAITDRTRAIVTISPNNPTGAVYPESVLRAVNDICRVHSLYHVHDEAYEYFTYEGVQHFSPGAIAESTNHTISLYSLSKSYGFAGWRIGYMVIPDHLYFPVLKVQDTNLICPSVIAQEVALRILHTGSGYCRKHLETIATNRQIFLHELKTIEHLCHLPRGQGAFYFLLQLHTDLDSFELVKQLIQSYGVAALPGSTFGIHTGCYLRIAYGALQPERATIGIQRLTQGLRKLLEQC